MDTLLRKQTTVMSADAVGYAAMMANDAASTLGSLLWHFRLIERLVRQHRGRIVDAPGDNLLAEFAEEIDALRCAVEVQQALAEDDPQLPASWRMRFRIGLHRGEALQHAGRLFGDTVNVAARLQAAAEPGGILMSEAVAERTAPHRYRAVIELGPRKLKNIPYPVSAYRPVI
jgi:adenylate cyclase